MRILTIALIMLALLFLVDHSFERSAKIPQSTAADLPSFTGEQRTSEQQRLLEVANAHRRHAVELWRSDQRQEAIRELEDSLRVLEAVFSNGLPVEARNSLLELLLAWYSTTYNYDDAVRICEKIVTSDQSRGASAAWELIDNQSQLRHFRGIARLEKKEKELHHAETAEYRKVVPLGLVSDEETRVREALPVLRRWLKRYSNYPFSDNIVYLNMLKELSTLEKAIVHRFGDATEEKASLKTVDLIVQTSDKIYGQKHPNTIQYAMQLSLDYTNIAMKRQTTGAFAEARVLLSEAREELARHLPTDSPYLHEINIRIDFVDRLKGIGKEGVKQLANAGLKIRQAHDEFGRAFNIHDKTAAETALKNAEESLNEFKSLVGKKNHEYLAHLQAVLNISSAFREGLRSGRKDKLTEQYRTEYIELIKDIFSSGHFICREAIDVHLDSLSDRSYFALEENSIELALTDLAQAATSFKEVHGDSHWRTTTLQKALEDVAFIKQMSPENRRRLETAGEHMAKAYQFSGMRQEWDLVRAIPGQPMTAGPNARKEKIRAAIKEAQDAIDIYKKVLPNSLTLIGKLRFLANLHHDIEELRETETIQLQVLELAEKKFGDSHRRYAQELEQLAAVYAEMGQWSRELRLRENALSIRDKEGHDLEFSQALTGLINLYVSSGRLQKADVLIWRSLQIQYNNLLFLDFGYCLMLRDRASVLWSMGFELRAIHDLQTACSLLRMGLPGAHPNTVAAYYGSTMHQLGSWYLSMRKPELSKVIRRRAIEILEQVPPEYGAQYLCGALTEEAIISLDALDEKAAQVHLGKARSVRKWISDSTALDIDIEMIDSVIEQVKGKPEMACRRVEKVLDAAFKRLQLTFAVTSEREQWQLARSKNMRQLVDGYIQFAVEARFDATQVYQHLLRWKGIGFARQYLSRLHRRNPDAIAEIRMAARYGVVEDLEQAQRRLEGNDPMLARAWAEIPPHDIAKELQVGEVVLDFFEYTAEEPAIHGDVNWFQEERLAVFVLRANKPVVLIDLGPVAPIEAAVLNWLDGTGVKPRTAKEGGAKSPDQLWQDAGKELCRLIWTNKIQPKIADAKKVLVSPDGVLCHFPFAALPTRADDPKSFLIHTHQIVMVPTVQLLARHLQNKPERSVAENSLLMIGDINYEGNPGGNDFLDSSVAVAPEGRGRRPSDQQPRLEMSDVELRKIGEVFEAAYQKSPKKLIKDEATESAFRGCCAGKRFLVFSTHGRFQRNEIIPSSRVKRPAPYLAVGPMQGDPVGPHPWLMCSLAMTGANRGFVARKDSLANIEYDDGWLTGVEIAELDLSQTDLVLLSACNTNVGVNMTGEGLIGLQRAFEVSGARSVIGTYWNVQDDEAILFSTTFFEAFWKNKKTKLAALQEAQLKLMNRPGDATNPRSWAAWSLSGHIGNSE